MKKRPRKTLPHLPADALAQAITCHQTGNLAKAARLYNAILAVDPADFDALHYLGVLQAQRERYDDALALIGRALNVNPLAAEALSNYGRLLRLAGRPAEALAACDRALAIAPDFAEALTNRGAALQDLGRHGDALASYDGALALNPQSVIALNNRSVVLKDMQRIDDALAGFDAALAIAPGFPDAHCNRGNALQDLKRFEQALASYEQALAIRPDFPEALMNRGNVLLEMNQAEAALASLRQALLLKPEYAEAHNNLGLLLKRQAKLDDAVASFRKAISIKPDFAEAHSNLGVTLQMQGRFDDAIVSLRNALACKPDYADVHANLVFLHSFHAFLDPPEYLALARSWELACVPAAKRQVARNRIFRRTPLAGRRLKVGYVSGDYRQHAVSFFVEPLFKHHNRARIELFAYYTLGYRDDVTARIESLAEHWVPAHAMSVAALRDRIEADNIDVLIDLAGYTAHSRLEVFAHRAAPVQAQYLGLGSSGLTEMDNWIGENILTPPEMDGHFSEQVWRLPRAWMCYNDQTEAPACAWRPAQDGSVWLGSFTQLGKLTPGTLALWARVLQALPEARLLLKTKLLTDAGNHRRILNALTALGIAANRIEMQDGSITPGWKEHMAYYDRLDIALDPIGVLNGTTTTCDTLWMGVPLVTLAGDRMASRMTASMLNALGHPEWITQSETEYIDKVVALARDVNLRKTLRANQRVKMAQSPLCDARDLALNLENAYFEMFQRWVARQTSRVVTDHGGCDSK